MTKLFAILHVATEIAANCRDVGNGVQDCLWVIAVTNMRVPKLDCRQKMDDANTKLGAS